MILKQRKNISNQRTDFKSYSIRHIYAMDISPIERIVYCTRRTVRLSHLKILRSWIAMMDGPQIYQMISQLDQSIIPMELLITQLPMEQDIKNKVAITCIHGHAISIDLIFPLMEPAQTHISSLLIKVLCHILLVWNQIFGKKNKS